MPTKPKPTDKLANERQICHLLGIQKERLAELVKKKVLTVESKTKGEAFYSVLKVVRAYVAHLKKEAEEIAIGKNRRTVGEIAELLGVDERWVNRLVKEKGLPKLGHGTYDIGEVVKYRLKQLREELEVAQAGGEDAISAKTRLTQAQADLKELELAEKAGELVTVRDVQHTIEPVLASIRSTLMGIPKHAAREWDNKKLEPYLENFMRQALTNLSELQVSFKSPAEEKGNA